jgi:hypothetical protein
VTVTVEVKSEAKNNCLVLAPPPPAVPPALIVEELFKAPLPPPPPPAQHSTRTKATPAGLVHVPEEVKV